MKEIKIGGLGGNEVAIVDDEDYEKQASHHWIAKVFSKSGGRTIVYAAREVVDGDGTHHTLLMHRQILGATRRNQYTDHKNHNGLDNRKSNIRLGTSQQNQQNRRKTIKPTSSQYKGVSLDRSRGLWYACIRHCGSSEHLGRFSTEEAAALAYNEAATRLFETPFLNVIVPKRPAASETAATQQQEATA